MATIKSVADGGFSDPLTWDLRVPSDGDTIEIYHHVTCEPTMKTIKGAQIRMMSADAILDTSRIKFSGVARVGSGINRLSGAD